MIKIPKPLRRIYFAPVGYRKVLLGELRIPKIGEMILPGLSDRTRSELARLVKYPSVVICEADESFVRFQEWCVTVIEK
jgi:hypothetical protein